jgi:hypothetical protein
MIKNFHNIHSRFKKLSYVMIISKMQYDYDDKT